MANIFVTPTGAGEGNGTSWENAYAGTNEAEDRPVSPADAVHVAPGTYRATHTCDISGTPGNPITYRGDYDGAMGSPPDPITGRVVRITGSNDDIGATRQYAIFNARTYRTFRGFQGDLTTSHTFYNLNSDNCVFDKCYIGDSGSGSHGIFISASTNFQITNCKFRRGATGFSRALSFYHASGQSNAGHVVNNCIFNSCFYGILTERVGGISVINSDFSGYYGIRIQTALPAGQAVTVNNSIYSNLYYAVYALSVGEIVEDYNSFFGNITDRTNVAVGANSNTYPPLFDSRWFFELASRGQKLVSPFDLSAASQLINVAGTSPTTTDLRGQAVIGAEREWGALEYNSALSRAVGMSRGRTI